MVTLVDCTLRDSSYVVNFQFTALDTRNIFRGLEKAGIDLIEVGHGLGLGASSPKNGIAFESDAEYIESAVEVRNTAKIGAFFIPGIGSGQDIVDAKKAGLDFVRVGNNATEIDATERDIATAVEQGLGTHLNLMKTYAVEPAELARATEQCRDWGLDSIYVVDSAGCMLPHQVAEYVRAIKDACGLPLGFHCHNNLGLANANCLAAIEAGAEYVDGTLRGMGRSAGNAQTEVLSFLLKEAGYEIGVDTFLLFETAERYLTPLVPLPQGHAPLDVVIGMSRFHSGYLPRFKRVLDKYDVDLNRLIMSVSSIDCVDPSEELIESVARDLSRTEA